MQKNGMDSSIARSTPRSGVDSSPLGPGAWRTLLIFNLAIAIGVDFFPLVFALHPHPDHELRRILAALLVIIIPAPWLITITGSRRLKKILDRTEADRSVQDFVHTQGVVLLAVIYGIIVVVIPNLFEAWR
jgi:uncharacterized membrane protein